MEGDAKVDVQTMEDSFVWDDNSQLYYHARSGFYHDPNAGWYYSTKDGLYYRFEDGNYILLDSYKDSHSVIDGQGESPWDKSKPEASHEVEYDRNNDENEGETDQMGCMESCSREVLENPPPTSEWLEDTLIDLYLSGYSNAAPDVAADPLLFNGTDDSNVSMLSTDESKKRYGQGDGELTLDDQAVMDSSATVFHEETSWEEESWRAQYGQVLEQKEESGSGYSIVDMWDWSMVKEIQKDGNCPVAKIVGRLVQPSLKLHPSMPSRGGRLRTASISKVHLDLVQVRSGQVYKLRNPNAEYLATLSRYDASDPTKEWGFPEFSVQGSNETCESNIVQSFSEQYMNSGLNIPCVKKKKTNVYRDRAAERRALHGEFGLAPGQKKSVDKASSPSLQDSDSNEEAAAEALDMSVGAGSYAQKILRGMGWKEGEGLGKTQQGMKEPLQGIKNKGTAGLGWPSGQYK